MKVCILCGGRGLRFGDADIPKPMQLVGGRPLLWHIMRWYAKHGHREFVLCLGWRGDVIRDCFEHTPPDDTEAGWDIQCVDTGLDTATGGRLLRVRELVGERFMLSYGDCIADVHLPALLDFHLSHGKAATMTVVQPRCQWGVADMNIGGEVHRFQEKPRYNGWCNGGFMVMDSRVFQYVEQAAADRVRGMAPLAGSDPDGVTLEHAMALMANAGQLHGFKHGGFWRGCDTEKDRQELEALWNNGNTLWKT